MASNGLCRILEMEIASPDETRLVTATYPPGVRAWIKRNGGLTQKLILLRGRQLAALYSHCQ